MKIKVIKVTRNGEVGYLKSVTIFGSAKPIVDNPLEAYNYANDEPKKLETDLKNIRLGGNGAMSGVMVDTIHMVEFEVTVQEVSCVVGRTE